MAHAGHSHHHHAGGQASRARLLAALCLILALMAAELTGGILAHSLALLSDSAHMLTDAGALALSLFALRLAARPAGGSLTFGLRRVEILSAQANGLTLLILAALIAYEAITRLVSPSHVHGVLTLVVALVGALVNVAALAVLSGAGRGNLNIEGSFQHLLTDLFGFLGTAVGAIVILTSGFQRADPLVSLLIAALMTRSGYALVKASARIFLEAAPAELDPEQIGLALAREPGVVEVHDLHVWEVASGFPALSAHVLVGADCNCHGARRRMEEMLHERFALDHTTLQVDHEGGELLEISAPVRGGGSAPR